MTPTDDRASRDVLGPLRPRSEDLAYVDGLTGLFNQRLLNELFDEKFDELLSLAGSFALVMIDLDLFKKVNDRYGHLSGDEVLRATAELLCGIFRESDLLFRYGGDEFLVLLPGATAVEAETLGQRAREMMQRHDFLDHEEKAKIDVPLSFSIGVAAWPGDGETGREVLGSADERLYIEKGRQTVARHRRRMVMSGIGIAVAVVALTILSLLLLDRGAEDTTTPIVIVEPAPVVAELVENGEREALLREIAELQRQIDVLRRSQTSVPSLDHGGPRIADLEQKILELTARLREQSNGDGQETPAVTEEPRPAAVAEPARRPAPAVVEPQVESRVVVVPPRLRNRVIPAYPLLAKERGIEATIDLELLIDESGRVAEARTVGRTAGFGFEEAARRAALASEWSPATRNGTPIRMRTTLQVRFEITR